MADEGVRLRTEREIEEAILQEKAKGTPDIEIGEKYGVTYRYIERLITKAHGINASVLKVSKEIKTLAPKDFQEEQATVWSFKQRGNWATHSGEYRGNWSPYIPRNVILKYSKPGELALDYFCGAGTTAVECKLLGRRCIAFDINEKAIELAKENINFKLFPQQFQTYKPELRIGDARDLSFLGDNSVDLICAHPPYANIIQYTDNKKDDLSFLDIDDFLREMAKVAKESFRVLKPGRQCAILIGDMRRQKHVIPLGFKLINVYLDAGFKLRELVIKRQHNCKTTGFWYENSVKFNFLLLAHEYLPIFEKPSSTAARERRKEKKYQSVVPIAEKAPLPKKELDKLEATTVWLLPEEKFEDRLNKNVIDRYSDGKNFSLISFTSQATKGAITALKREQKCKKLLFIKSPFLREAPSRLNIDFYLQEVKELISEKIPEVNNGGFIAIQTQDVRIDGYIEPLAKRLVDMLTSDSLWLKEIVVVTTNGANSTVQASADHLKITHQYLLVYEVRR